MDGDKSPQQGPAGSVTKKGGISSKNKGKKNGFGGPLFSGSFKVLRNFFASASELPAGDGENEAGEKRRPVVAFLDVYPERHVRGRPSAGASASDATTSVVSTCSTTSSNSGNVDSRNSNEIACSSPSSTVDSGLSSYDADLIGNMDDIDYAMMLGLQEQEVREEPSGEFQDLLDNISKEERIKQEFSASTLAIFTPKKLMEPSKSTSEADLHLALSKLNNGDRRDSQTRMTLNVPNTVRTLISPVSASSYLSTRFPRNLEFLYRAYLFRPDVVTFRFVSFFISLFVIALGLLSFFIRLSTVPFNLRAILLIISISLGAAILSMTLITSQKYFKKIYQLIYILAAVCGGVLFVLAVPVSDIQMVSIRLTTRYLCQLTQYANSDGYSFKILIFVAVVYLWLPLPNLYRFLLGMSLSVAKIALSACFFRSEYVWADVIQSFSVNLIGLFFGTSYSVMFRRSFIGVRIFFQNQKNLEKARIHSEKLLKNILPVRIVDEFKQTRKRAFQKSSLEQRRSVVSSIKPTIKRHDILKDSYSHSENCVLPRSSIYSGINDHFAEIENVSIMFADIVGFTAFSSQVSADYLVTVLSVIFEKFDIFAETLQLEKIKTIGDCYQVCAGIPEGPKTREERVRSVRRLCTMASCMLKVIEETSELINRPLQIRIGIHTGSVLAGVIGGIKFKYDIWSEDVRIAQLIESTSEPSMVQISETTASMLDCDRRYILVPRKPVDLGNGKSINVFKLTHIWSHSYELIVKPQVVQQLAEVDTLMTRVSEDSISSSSEISRPLKNQASSKSLGPAVDMESVVRQIQGAENLPLDKQSVDFFDSSIQRKWKKEMKNKIDSLFTAFKDPELEKQFRESCVYNYGLLASWGSILFLFVYLLNGILYAAFYSDTRGFAVGMPVYTACLLLGLGLLITREFQRRKEAAKREASGKDQLEEGKQAPAVTKSHPIIDLLREPYLFSRLLYAITFVGAVAAGASTFYTLGSQGEAMIYFSFYVFMLSSSFFLGAGSCELNMMVVLSSVTYLVIYLSSIDYSNANLVFWSFKLSFPLFSLLLAMVTVTSNRRIDLATRKIFLITQYLEDKLFEINYIKNEADRLLQNILPLTIANRLLKTPDKRVAERFPEVCVLFISICNFHDYDHQSQKRELLVLNRIFSAFDQYCQMYGVEKIKTSGTGGSDSRCFQFLTRGNVYMAMAGGIPCNIIKPATIRLVDFTLKLFEVMKDVNGEVKFDFELRAGLHSNFRLKSVGPAVGGVIGRQKFCFDIWGDAVNVAARMEQTGVAGRIQITEEYKEAVSHMFESKSRAGVAVKGKGIIDTYLIIGRKLKERKESKRHLFDANPENKP